MTMQKHKQLACLLVLGWAITTVGCMASPYHGEVLEHKRENVQFIGFLQTGREVVEIQAFNPQNKAWETIGRSRSEEKPREWSGNHWYAWYTDIQVPERFWQLEHPQYVGERVYYSESARVRAKTDQGLTLTVDKEFTEWFDVYTPNAPGNAH